jgi:hypothetical protein
MHATEWSSKQEFVRRTIWPKPARIVVSSALALLLLCGLTTTSGAATGVGHVTGSIRYFGGVAGTPRTGTPTSGRVVFKPAHGTSRAIKVEKSGAFDVRLRAGTYIAFGGPPGWHDECRVNNGSTFKVARGKVINVIVACDAI